MKRLIAPLALTAVALAPGLAQAKTKVYKGTFQYVGADGDYVTGSFGKVQLVDGKRNDKLSVHVRRLAGNATYVFRLQQAPKACAADAPGGTDVPGWTYRRGGVLKTSRKGVANSKATSRSFTVNPGVEYFVGVYRTTATGGVGEIALCAKLTSKHHKAKPHKPHGGDKPHGKSEHSRGHGEDKPHGKSEDAPGHAEDKPNGKSEDAPGQADDKQRGKSEDAPGHAEDKQRGKSEDAPGHDKKPRH